MGQALADRPRWFAIQEFSQDWFQRGTLVDAQGQPVKTGPRCPTWVASPEYPAQTVSRYFTGSGYVGADTGRRIEAAINELEYTFNESARNLRLQSTQTIGVLTTGPSVYGSWSIQTGLLQAADAAHYALITSRVEVEPDDPTAESAVHEAPLRFHRLRSGARFLSKRRSGSRREGRPPPFVGFRLPSNRTGPSASPVDN